MCVEIVFERTENVTQNRNLKKAKKQKKKMFIEK